MQIERFRKTRGGMRAKSPCFHCQIQKIIDNTPKPIKSPMIFESPQPYFCPPQVRAKRMQQIRAKNNVSPIMSKCLSLSTKDVLLFDLLDDCANGTKASTIRTTSAPAGTLLQPGLSTSCFTRSLLTHIQKHQPRFILLVPGTDQFHGKWSGSEVVAVVLTPSGILC